MNALDKLTDEIQDNFIPCRQPRLIPCKTAVKIIRAAMPEILAAYELHLFLLQFPTVEPVQEQFDGLRKKASTYLAEKEK